MMDAASLGSAPGWLEGVYMKPWKRIFGVAIMALSVVLAILCLGAIVGSWVVNNSVTNQVVDVLTGVESGLSVADEAVDTPAGRHAKFRYLGGFTGTGLPGNDNHRMLRYGFDDVIFFNRDGQFIVITQWR